MALIVEDGTGVANAESFVTVAETDAGLSAHYGTTDWAGKSNDEKEQILRQACDYIVTTYSGRWKGTKVAGDQALPWPRKNVYDEDGYCLYSGTIPWMLKRAQMEASRILASGKSLINDTSETRLVKRTKIGPLEKEYADTLFNLQSHVPSPLVHTLLADLLLTGSYNVPVMRS